MTNKIKNWIKDKWVRFKKLIIAVFGISAVLAAPLAIPENPSVVIEKAQAQYVTAPENNGYKIGVRNYQSEYKTDVTADGSLKYMLDDKYIAFKPVEMRWDTKKTVRNAKSSILNDGFIGNDTDFKQIQYKEAFDKSIDLYVDESERDWKKIVKINSLDELGDIPKDAEYLEIEYAVDTNMIIDGWNKEDHFDIGEKTRLGDFSYIEPAHAWDSYRETVCNDVEMIEDKCDPQCKSDLDGCDFCDVWTEEQCETKDNRIQINSYFENGKFVKQIPVEWLKTAQYPIYTDTDITYGTASEFESGTTYYINVRKIDENKLVTCFMDYSDGYAGKCRVATVSGTTFTWGTTAEFDDDVYITNSVMGLCVIDTDKFVTMYADDGNDDDGYAEAAFVSGTSITYKTAEEFNTGDTENMSCAGIDTNKIALLYNDETASDMIEALACIVNATTGAITCGSANSIATSQATVNRYGICKLDTDKFLTVFPYNADSNRAYAMAYTVSGTTLTDGAANAVYYTTDARSCWCSQMDTDKAVLGYAGSSSGTSRSVAVTISGTTITDGSTYDTYDQAYPVDGVSYSDTTFVTVDSYGFSGYGYSYYNEVDWATKAITAGSAETFESGNIGGYTDYGLSIDLVSTDKVVICFQDDADSDKGKCIIGDGPSTGPVGSRRIIIIQ